MLPKGTDRSVAGATESVTEMAGVGTDAPVPLTFTVTEGFVVSLLGTLKLSVNVPAAVGANATVRVQAADGLMVWFEQVLFVIEKGAANGFVDPTAPTSRSAVPVFVTVTVWLADAPAFTLPKGTVRSVVGATESVTDMAGVGATAPVPLTFTVTVALEGSLLGMLKLSEKVPAAAGAKATVRVQEADGVRVLLEQVSFEMEKGAASGFAEATAPSTRLAVPEFVTVTVWLAEAPELTLPKGTDRSVVGATESVTDMAGVGATAPVPLTFTATEGFAVSLLGMLKLSEKVPVAVGAKATVRVQEADGLIVWFEQVSFEMEKGAASGFVDPTVPITRFALPEFVTVTVWLADAPVFTLPKGTVRSVDGATESVTEMAGAAALATVNELIATISSP